VDEAQQNKVMSASEYQNFMKPPADVADDNLDDQMIRKLPSGKYRLYSRKKNPKTGKRRNLGTFSSRAAAARHERAVQAFKHRG